MNSRQGRIWQSVGVSQQLWQLRLEGLTLAPLPHPLSLSLIKGVITSNVNPKRNKQAEYDMSIIGHCHTNTMLRFGRKRVAVVARDCDPDPNLLAFEGSMRSGLYRSITERASAS